LAALTAQFQSKFGMFQSQAWIQQQGSSEELTELTCDLMLPTFAFVHVFQCKLPHHFLNYGQEGVDIHQ